MSVDKLHREEAQHDIYLYVQNQFCFTRDLMDQPRLRTELDAVSILFLTDGHQPQLRHLNEKITATSQLQRFISQQHKRHQK